MHTLAALARKGGVGKSQIAINLAVVAAQNGLRTLIVDVDPQATCGYWMELREQEAAEAENKAKEYEARGDKKAASIERARYPKLELGVIEISQGRMDHHISRIQASNEVDLLIIDTAGKDGDVSIKTSKLADYVIIPTSPSAQDIAAIATTMDVVQNTRTPAAIVINDGQPNSNESAEVAEYFRDPEGLNFEINDDYHVADTYIHHRQPIRHAYRVGMGITEYEPDGRAAAEVRAVYNFVAAKLNALQAQNQKLKKAS